MIVFAEQGYVVVAFNPTGSTGFGQAVTDRMQNQWGGLPYQDLVLGWEYIENNLPTSTPLAQWPSVPRTAAT
jgi:dipeptidyl aminopeptidase/acylaminoacyl peptidase